MKKRAKKKRKENQKFHETLPQNTSHLHKAVLKGIKQHEENSGWFTKLQRKLGLEAGGSRIKAGVGIAVKKERKRERERERERERLMGVERRRRRRRKREFEKWERREIGG